MMTNCNLACYRTAMKRTLMKNWILTALTCFFTFILNAQLLTWSPPFPVDNDATQTLVITLDASKGNRALFNYTPTNDVYIHIGVITNLSSSSSDWKYVKTTWGTADAAARATYAGNNKWQFTITGSLRAFFGITNPAETIQKIALLFRNGSGATVQRNSDGSDMYIPVYTSNLSVRLESPATEPRYNPVPEQQNWTVGTSFTITGRANKASNMKLYHNNAVIASQNGVQTITAASTITSIGSQTIVVEANDGSVIRFDTINIFVTPPNAPVAPLPAGVRDGINYQPGDTSVILVLHAPGKNIVSVIGEFNNWTLDTSFIMRKTPDGNKFWLRVRRLTPGVEYAYQYSIEDTLRIADPYAEKILDPWNDQFISSSTYPNLKPYPAGQSGIVSVLQTASPTFNWTVNNFSRPDKRGLIIYELLLRDFVAAHDWKTLSDTISYLKRLGVNAIELMPFNEFEGNISWGYNPDFYFASDKYYGPKNTLKQFIDLAHRNGIAVIMDIALNHSFGLSPMVQLYWDRQNNRPAPNNPWYNPEPKHPFNVGFDFNHESLATRYFTSRVVEHWLQEYKIDGFRFDLSKGFTQVNSENNVNAWSAYDASRVAIWKRYYDTVQSKSTGSYVILEHFADNQEEKELADYGMLLWGTVWTQYQEAAMGYLANSNFQNGIHTVRGWNHPHLITYMESHDEERIMYKNINFGNSSGSYNIKDTTTSLKRMELNGAFLFTIPGPKMIWQFGELGYDYPINYCPNGTVNNSCRTDPKPIRWDYQNQPRRQNVYNVWSRLINLRHHPLYRNAFLSGTIDQNLGGGFKWLRVNSGDTSRLVVVGNFDVTPQTGTITFPTAGTWYNYLDSSLLTTTGSAQSITLQPGEYRVYINRNLNNSAVTPIFNVPAPTNILQLKVYPNPAQYDFTLELNLPENGNVTVDIINPGGQRIASAHQAFMPRGKHQINLNRKELKLMSGAYYLRIRFKNSFETVPIVVY